MKFRNTRLSTRTLALLAATILLATSGGYFGTKAALTYFSEDANAEFELEHLHVHLIENGRDVCEGENIMTTVHREDGGDAKKAKYNGDLLIDNLGYQNKTHDDTAAYLRADTPGDVIPGWTYTEEIKAANGSDVDQYLRLTIRKYWVDKETGKKITKLDPKLIKLSYNGKDYNVGPWKINESESTAESDTYYYTSILKGSKDLDNLNMTEALFNELTISSDIVSEENMTKSETTSEDGNKIKTIYTYSYDYDNCTFYIEADVQAIQTHNAADAVSSLWGVSNISAGNGKMTVK